MSFYNVKPPIPGSIINRTAPANAKAWNDAFARTAKPTPYTSVTGVYGRPVPIPAQFGTNRQVR